MRRHNHPHGLVRQRRYERARVAWARRPRPHPMRRGGRSEEKSADPRQRKNQDDPPFDALNRPGTGHQQATPPSLEPPTDRPTLHRRAHPIQRDHDHCDPSRSFPYFLSATAMSPLYSRRRQRARGSQIASQEHRPPGHDRQRRCRGPDRQPTRLSLSAASQRRRRPWQKPKGPWHTEPPHARSASEAPTPSGVGADTATAGIGQTRSGQSHPIGASRIASVADTRAGLRSCRIAATRGRWSPVGAECCIHLAPADWSGEANSEQPGLSVELARAVDLVSLDVSGRPGEAVGAS